MPNASREHSIRVAHSRANPKVPGVVQLVSQEFVADLELVVELPV